MAVYEFHCEQHINASMQEVWDFISSPKNLQRITPEYMGFEVISKHLEEKMYPGMIIQYKVKPLLGIKMTWVTEITHVENLSFFVDEQRVGPYKMWHHEHKIEQTENGVLMTDLLHYQPPMGFLGRIANALTIRKKLDEIFAYRKQAVDEVFNNSSTTS